jgi:hypothetical protein
VQVPASASCPRVGAPFLGVAAQPRMIAAHQLHQT